MSPSGRSVLRLRGLSFLMPSTLGIAIGSLAAARQLGILADAVAASEPRHAVDANTPANALEAAAAPTRGSSPECADCWPSPARAHGSRCARALARRAGADARASMSSGVHELPSCCELPSYRDCRAVELPSCPRCRACRAAALSSWLELPSCELARAFTALRRVGRARAVVSLTVVSAIVVRARATPSRSLSATVRNCSRSAVLRQRTFNR